jgi:hypothetical protein
MGLEQCFDDMFLYFANFFREPGACHMFEVPCWIWFSILLPWFYTMLCWYLQVGIHTNNSATNYGV